MNNKLITLKNLILRLLEELHKSVLQRYIDSIFTLAMLASCSMYSFGYNIFMQSRTIIFSSPPSTTIF